MLSLHNISYVVGGKPRQPTYISFNMISHSEYINDKYMYKYYIYVTLYYKYHTRKV